VRYHAWNLFGRDRRCAAWFAPGVQRRESLPRYLHERIAIDVHVSRLGDAVQPADMLGWDAAIGHLLQRERLLFVGDDDGMRDVHLRPDGMQNELRQHGRLRSSERL
jgi:hypothetical protein